MGYRGEKMSNSEEKMMQLKLLNDYDVVMNVLKQ